MTGTIKRLVSDKGFGFIQDAQGVERFFPPLSREGSGLREFARRAARRVRARGRTEGATRGPCHRGVMMRPKPLTCPACGSHRSRVINVRDATS